MTVSANKNTPKSCSCRMCRRGKGSKCGRYFMTIDERAHRHAANASLRVLRQSRGDDVILDAAPVGGYYD